MSQTLHQITHDTFLAFRQTEKSRFETLTLYNLFSQSISLKTQNNISSSVHYCITHRFKEEIVPFHYKTPLQNHTNLSNVTLASLVITYHRYSSPTQENGLHSFILTRIWSTAGIHIWIDCTQPFRSHWCLSLMWTHNLHVFCCCTHFI